MRLRDILSLAAHNLRESPLRTALCALSVAVGSGALLLILSIGLYGRKQVDAGLQTLGVSGLSVYTESGHAGTILSAALADEIEQDVDGIRTLDADQGAERHRACRTHDRTRGVPWYGRTAR